MRDLCATAVDTAVGAGAEYADARAVVRRTQRISTKNGRVDQLSDTESEGIGVRVLVNGAWGFACDRRLTAEGARDAALRACAFARAAGGRGPRALAPLAAHTGRYQTEFARDPFSVSIADKVDHCLRADEALNSPDVIVRQASVRALREHRILLSSEGTDVEQETVEATIVESNVRLVMLVKGVHGFLHGMGISGRISCGRLTNTTQKLRPAHRFLAHRCAPT